MIATPTNDTKAIILGTRLLFRQDGSKGFLEEALGVEGFEFRTLAGMEGALDEEMSRTSGLARDKRRFGTNQRHHQHGEEREKVLHGREATF